MALSRAANLSDKAAVTQATKIMGKLYVEALKASSAKLAMKFWRR